MVDTGCEDYSEQQVVVGAEYDDYDIILRVGIALVQAEMS